MSKVCPGFHTVWIWPAVIVLAQVTFAAKDDVRNFGHERVLENVMKNYRQAQFLVRPANNTTAEVGLGITYIKSFDKGNGRLVAGYRLTQRWRDSRLRWEDRSVREISFPPESIWKPDWKLINSMDYKEKVDSSVLPMATYDGIVTWIQPAEYTTVCERELDSWKCQLILGSWMHNAEQLKQEFLGNSTLVDTSMWRGQLYGYDIHALPGSIETRYDDCCPDVTREQIHFRFLLSVIEGGVASASRVLSISAAVVSICLVLSTF